MISPNFCWTKPNTVSFVPVLPHWLASKDDDDDDEDDDDEEEEEEEEEDSAATTALARAIIIYSKGKRRRPKQKGVKLVKRRLHVIIQYILKKKKIKQNQ